MPPCAVISCKNHTGDASSDDSSINFYCFPVEQELRKHWLEKCGLSTSTYEDDVTQWRICSEHFSEDDFDIETPFPNKIVDENERKCLKKEAIPRLNLVKIKEEPVDDEDKLPPLESISQTQSPPRNPLVIDASKIQGFIKLQKVNTSPIQVISPFSANISSSHCWPGVYDFKVFFGIQQKNVKSVTWNYSNITNKLYVQKSIHCPIHFSTNAPVSGNVQLRAMVMFSNAEFAKSIVNRCYAHTIEDFNMGIAEAEHLIRCNHDGVVYEKDSAGRYSVIVPFENPTIGEQFVTYLFSFTCFGSCVGGPNRRPLMVVFTLEKDSQIIGKNKVDLKICACPGRDKVMEEKHFVIKNGTHETLKHKETSSNIRTLSEAFEFTKDVEFPHKKPKLSPSNTNYTIVVNDVQCYEFLNEMKNLYEMCSQMKKLSPDMKKILFNKVLQKENDDE